MLYLIIGSKIFVACVVLEVISKFPNSLQQFKCIIIKRAYNSDNKCKKIRRVKKIVDIFVKNILCIIMLEY